MFKESISHNPPLKSLQLGKHSIYFDSGFVKSMMVQYSLLRFLVLCYSLLPLLAEDGRKYQRNCPTSFHCGKFGHIQFPFTNKNNLDCGLPIRGCDDQNAATEVQLSNQTWYEFESINGNNSISVIDHKLQRLLASRSCNAFTYNIHATRPPSTPVLHFQIEMEHSITLLRCRHASYRPSNKYIKYTSCNGYDIYYHTQSPETDDMYTGTENACSTIQLPIKSSPSMDYSTGTALYNLLTAGFRIILLLSEDCGKCYENGGQCQVDKESLYCAGSKEQADPPQPRKADPPVQAVSHDKQKWFTKGVILKIGLAVGFLNVITLKLEKATNKFDEARELGSGGYGNVYYGKLHDGREVAVKCLYEHNYRQVEQFMNEIEILTRLRHRNLVSLYGCSSRHSRELLLVYEYIPNGTVACHLHVDITRETDEINLSNLAIKKIQKRAFCELVDPSLGFELDQEFKRKIVSVAELAFQCLKEYKHVRPSMVEVLEELKRIDSGEDKPKNIKEADVNLPV
ncbi:Wall-associated receptor kinase, C-terminal [Sesbania bispinosa]|nr:Wall-associated receptor kinase, C-terminal [Sesbania bispinosa]